MTLEQQLREAARTGRLGAFNLWPTVHGWQANLTTDRVGWVIGIDADPVVAIEKAFASFSPPAPPQPAGDIFG